jgi:dephospho-CoA kinase
MERDGIGEEEALSRIKAQFPIEEKVGYADYVIHNEKTLEETRRQAQDLWQTLRKVQRGKK